LCGELDALRRPARPDRSSLQGAVARRMHAAVAPFADMLFVTPMAAVAGAVAEEVLAAMLAGAALRRAYVNNGGDIALHLSPGEQFAVGLVDRPDTPALYGEATVRAGDPSVGSRPAAGAGAVFRSGSPTP
jgi:ApbE superfamily uncharacterized protein (UPF0280 family)